MLDFTWNEKRHGIHHRAASVFKASEGATLSPRLHMLD